MERKEDERSGEERERKGKKGNGSVAVAVCERLVKRLSTEQMCRCEGVKVCTEKPVCLCFV